MNKGIKVIEGEKIMTVSEGWTSMNTVDIPIKYMEKQKDWRGKDVYKYTYWKLFVNTGWNKEEKVYRIAIPDEYKRITKAMSSPDVRFIKVGRALININSINRLEPQEGYTDIKPDHLINVADLDK